MFGVLMFVIAGMSASLAQNSSTGTRNSSLFAKASPQILFAQCPDSYTDFCYHGTCRFLVSEWEASCICSKGYIGSRCQYVDLLQVMAGEPRSFITVVLTGAFFLVVTFIGSTCLVIYFCRIKRERSRLNLLNNIDANG
ncbi:protransforming growth factor alpha-like isoform X2 [Pseudophryne corroboree]|uniref:protransforming growth factor alpha-like isoform X2 n=1 Tax=Pseudophryne corroboree TaxID=495146 RepID=UPI00308180EA